MLNAHSFAFACMHVVYNMCAYGIHLCINSKYPRKLSNRSCEEILCYEPLSQFQQAESRAQWAELGITQTWIPVNAQNLCRSIFQGLHNLSWSQGMPDLLWIQHKPALLTVKLLCCGWLCLIFPSVIKYFLSGREQDKFCGALPSSVCGSGVCSLPVPQWNLWTYPSLGLTVQG